MTVAGSRPRRTRRPWWRWALRRALVALAALAIATSAVVTTFVVTRCYGSRAESAAAPAPAGVAGYARAEAFTYLTLPEWYIVFSTDEYARFVRQASPSAFPYLGAVAQYWGTYDAACAATRGRYPFETGYHVMLAVIGVSLTAEYGIKSVYENTVGRLTGWLFSTDTPEDRFAATAAAEYGAFMHTTPWYQFPFGARLRALWGGVPWWGPHAVRKWERRFALTLELGTKGVYGWVMGLGSQAAYGAEDLTTYARVPDLDAAALAATSGRQVPSGDPVPVVALPRYEAFTPAAAALAARGLRFGDIAGNDEIVVGVLAPAGASTSDLPGARLVARQPVLTEPGRERLALAVPVPSLHEVLVLLRHASLELEHVYDY